VKNECSIVRDILPLYVEGMVGEDTAAFVEEHLHTCMECRREHEAMKEPLAAAPERIAAAPIRKIRSALRVKRAQAVLLAIAVAAAACLAAFACLAAPKFFPYSPQLLTVTEAADGSILISFAEEVTGYHLYRLDAPEGEVPIYQIEAWTTVWDELLPARAKQNAVISPDDGRPITVFYSQNHMDGTRSAQDVLIYGEMGHGVGGASLAGVGFWVMLLIAAGVFAAGCIAWLLLRKRRRLRIWAERVVLLPISYVIGHLCVLGFHTVSYSAFRDLCVIVLIALVVYCAMLFLTDMIERRIEMRQLTEGER